MPLRSVRKLKNRFCQTTAIWRISCHTTKWWATFWRNFYEWCFLSSISEEIRILSVPSPPLQEEVESVGYDRWGWNEPKPLPLSFQVRIHITIEYQADVSRRVQDLSHYMRGVIPPHEYTPEANIDFHIHPSNRNPSLYDAVRSLIATTRGYTCVVLLLRAQAEKEAGMARTKPLYGPPAISIYHFCFCI